MADLKINTSFLHGFLSGEKASTPLTLTGDGERLTLEKGDAFDQWMADGLKLADGRPLNEANRATLHRMIDAWLDGVEFDG